MVATMLSIEQSMHWWPLMQMHTTPKLLHMESASDPTYQGNFCICSFTDSRREISHRAEGVSAIRVICGCFSKLFSRKLCRECRLTLHDIKAKKTFPRLCFCRLKYRVLLSAGLLNQESLIDLACSSRCFGDTRTHSPA